MLKKTLLAAAVLGLATTIVHANEVSGYLIGNIGQVKDSIQHEQNDYEKELDASALFPHTDTTYKVRDFRADVNDLWLENKKLSLASSNPSNKIINNGTPSLAQGVFYAVAKENSLIAEHARDADIVNRKTTIHADESSRKHDIGYASVGLRYRF